MFSYLLKEKIKVLGKEIFCKVTGEIGSENDGKPYVLCITGGPGFAHALTERTLRHFIPIAEEADETLPHFIVFDNLGCGESELASDPDSEYTVNFFTDIAITLVQEVKKKLKLEHMFLCIEGGSFGSLVAMNIPARQPQWLNEDSPIRLMQIMSRVGPNGVGMKDYTLSFLEENHSSHPEYEKMVAAQNKLFSGSIQNKTDYLMNFVLPMAALYLNNPPAILTLINDYPEVFISGLEWMDWLCKLAGLLIEQLEYYNLMINQCSLSVLNHFFRKDFNGFNLLTVIQSNRVLYEKIPICLMVADNDHIVDSSTAKTIQKILRDTSAIMIFNDSHIISQGPCQTIHDRLMYAFLIDHHIEERDVNHDTLNFIMPSGFVKKLEEAGSQIDAKRETIRLLL